jgi:glutamate-1-semialdehyde 2,1-aminomutase
MNIQKCLAMQERARQRIPGMTQLLSKRPDMFSLGVWPGYYSKAKGVEVWDLDGNKYIDMSIGGIGANVLGYADPDVDQAVIGSIQNGSSCSLNSPMEVELADLLCSLHPWASKVRFSKTGGEAMSIAVRIARAYTGRDKIAFCGYHGWHDWYLAANLHSDAALDSHLLPGLEPCGVPKALAGTSLPFRYNHIEDLKTIVSKYNDELGVIVIESIRSESPLPGFLDEIREIANSIKAVLIVDEISAGFRLNTGGAHLQLGFQPDIAVFSKALGNGYPIGAIIGKDNIMDAAQKSFISSTNWTEQVGLAAAIACIKKHQAHNVGTHLVNIGNRVQEGWKKAADLNALKIRVSGIPPLSHFEFEYQNALELKSLFIQEMLKKGFLASNLFYAMYSHDKFHVDQYLKSVDESFALIYRALSENKVSSCLKGEPSSSGFKRLA